MSKKSFYRISWKEIEALLLIDFAILAAFAYFDISVCYNQPGVVVVSPQIVCTTQFFLSVENMVVLFAVVLITNFALSGYWHFVVKK